MPFSQFMSFYFFNEHKHDKDKNMYACFLKEMRDAPYFLCKKYCFR